MFHCKKTIALIFTCLLISGCAGRSVELQAQKREYDMSRLKQTEGITVVNVSTPLLWLARTFIPQKALSPTDKVQLASVINSVESVRVFMAETPQATEVLNQEFAFLMKPSFKGRTKYEELLTVRDKDSLVRIVGIPKQGGISNLMIAVGDPDESVVVLLDGFFSEETIERMIDQTN